MKELTKAEEQVMQILWELGKTSVKDVVDRIEDPKPAYNTISTIIRILEKKGFVDHEPVGKGYLYFPTIGKKEYTRKFVGNVLANYFNGSVKELVSFFAKEEKLDIKDVQDLLEELKSDQNIQ
jgi:BlaI family transcriptional regulator, penicillinase repressor